MAADIVKVSRNTENAPICSVSTQTVAFSHYNNISAQLPIDPKTGEIVIGCINDQTKQCLNNIQSIVESIGHVMDDVVKINIFVKNISDIDAIKKVYPTFFQGPLPTVTIAAVAALPVSDALVQIDALISNGEGTAPQAPCELIKVSRNTEHAPQGLYSQTAAFSHYNNLSAQLPIEPKTGEIVQGGIKEQSQQCLNNINAILESIGHTMADIVKTTIFLKNISDAEAINEVCGQFFPSYVPARSLVSVADLPMNALVQIDVVVSHGDGTPPQLPEDTRLLVIEENNTVNAPEVDYSHSVAFSHYNHISGQLPLSPKNNEVVAGGIKEQVKQCLENIKNIVESVEHVMGDIVKVNIQIKNMDDINIVNEVYTTFFNHELPARTVIGVSELPMDALIQIDAVVSNCEGTPPKY
ncbi:reactive intermediate/imine deaminase [Vibrio anguillarum]|uniref:Reactive intermediate/imine deaminase n=1 Tax=Vibrio anguillarum TaxID=55601 RepID=A0A289GG14_VIBAN|nr:MULTISPECIES: Rid family detoxifying hydrolase [Vibrio]ASW82485.1 reactive intermediate/imine deaminase [Vibrio anguillarum]AZS26678.1 reactive intermediate/imine deaminase [Vibrio anguillarum]MBF4311409.1 reactive intermediate/imine deaminase [Vibrio anguillarum]MBF4327053.1 reactive intermediate/imine deaminase [Vibrio anguillarum]MBT2921619.1 Rid family detoxifying hydrolase [Vibrio anguillarum]